MPTSAQVPDDVELRFRAAGDGRVEQVVGRDETTVTLLDPKGWGEWRKVALTRAAYIGRPFIVETSEGDLACKEGYLAVDARGYPYPIAKDEFGLIYQRADLEPAIDEADLVLPTVVERIEALEAELRAKQLEEWGDPRELAIALTSLEDVQMRVTRSRAKKLGVFKPVDLEKVEAGAERARFEAEVAEQ